MSLKDGAGVSEKYVKIHERKDVTKRTRKYFNTGIW